MSANKDETLRQFCDVTGADEARSRFFLESSNWQLDVALSSFYEHGGNADEPPPQQAAAPMSIPPLSDSDMDSPPGSPLAPQKKEKKKTSNTKFATLDSLQQQDSSDEEEVIRRRLRRSRKYFCDGLESCSDPNKVMEERDRLRIEVKKLKKMSLVLEAENLELKKKIASLKSGSEQASTSGQAFYAGGSERSGQQILGPGKSRKDIVTEMFKSVRERGAVVFEDEPSTASRGRQAFAGVGYRLGQATDEQEQAASANQPQLQPPQTGDDSVRHVRLRLYREGFTVDSGALRPYTDPDSAAFLTYIRRGEIPPELSDGGGEVRVSLEDRRLEECPRHTAKTHAFTGKGHMLGSPTPATIGATAPVAADVSDREANQRAAQEHVRLDETKPTTTVSIRLADGSRLTGRFNHSHTVADLRRYITLAEPAYQLHNFALVTTFPSAELVDPQATLAQANLLNTTLLQRLK